MALLEIASPTFEWLELAPVLLVLAGGCLGVLVEALFPRAWRFTAQVAVIELTVLAAFVVLVANYRAHRSGILAMGSIALDGPTYHIIIMPKCHKKGIYENKESFKSEQTNPDYIAPHALRERGWV